MDKPRPPSRLHESVAQTMYKVEDTSRQGRDVEETSLPPGGEDQ